MNFSVDTSAILNPWNRYYPPDRFPTFWQRFEGLIRGGRMFVSDEVLRELEEKDDAVLGWVEARVAAHPGLLVPLDGPVQTEVSAVLAAHPGLVDTRRNRPRADPFVIALARVKGLTVLTDEVLSNSAVRPHIPDVCRAMGVPCIRPLDLIRQEGWTF